MLSDSSQRNSRWTVVTSTSYVHSLFRALDNLKWWRMHATGYLALCKVVVHSRKGYRIRCHCTSAISSPFLVFFYIVVPDLRNKQSQQKKLVAPTRLLLSSTKKVYTRSLYSSSCDFSNCWAFSDNMDANSATCTCLETNLLSTAAKSWVAKNYGIFKKGLCLQSKSVQLQWNSLKLVRMALEHGCIDPYWGMF